MSEKSNPFSNTVTRREFSKMVPGGVTERTLDNWHARRIGPPRIKVGRTVLYERAAVESWIRRQIEKSAADIAACA